MKSGKNNQGLLSGERNIIVREEIPYSDHADGKEFWKIKVPFHLSMNKPDNQVSNAKPNQADNKKLGILGRYVRVLAPEGPGAVQIIVGRSCCNKPDWIGNVLLDFQPFLTDIGDAKINENPGESDDPEFDEFDQECLWEIPAHIRVE